MKQQKKKRNCQQSNHVVIVVAAAAGDFNEVLACPGAFVVAGGGDVEDVHRSAGGSYVLVIVDAIADNEQRSKSHLSRFRKLIMTTFCLYKELLVIWTKDSTFLIE